MGRWVLMTANLITIVPNSDNRLVFEHVETDRLLVLAMFFQLRLSDEVGI